jgi:hypothetical protein
MCFPKIVEDLDEEDVRLAIAKCCCLQQIELMTPAMRKNRAGEQFYTRDIAVHETLNEDLLHALLHRF